MGVFLLAPFIISLFLLLIVFYFLKRVFKVRNRSTTSKKKPIFFLVYASLLVVALIISVVFPNHKLVPLKDYLGDYDGEAYFYEIMNNERSIDSIASFKQSEETHSMSGDVLEFNDTNVDEYFQTFNMLIVQDSSLTDTFTIETYETPYIYDGKDISTYVPSVELNGSDGNVELHFPKKNAILNMYDFSFPFKQFAKDEEAFSGWGSFQLPSDFLTIIYIPEGVTPNVAHLVGIGDAHVKMIKKE